MKLLSTLLLVSFGSLEIWTSDASPVFTEHLGVDSTTLDVLYTTVDEILSTTDPGQSDGGKEDSEIQIDDPSLTGGETEEESTTTPSNTAETPSGNGNFGSFSPCSCGGTYPYYGTRGGSFSRNINFGYSYPCNCIGSYPYYGTSGGSFSSNNNFGYSYPCNCIGSYSYYGTSNNNLGGFYPRRSYPPSGYRGGSNTFYTRCTGC